MSRLFLITWRWMKKDRKRTLLSFLSILLAVYMMTVLGIYFSSTVSFLRSNEKYENGDYHVLFYCDDIKQAEKIASNAAVESSTCEFTGTYSFLNDYLNSYADKSVGAVGYVPAFSINGKPLSNVADLSPYFVESHGNDNEQNLTDGRYPQKEGEIVISEWLAQKYGLSVGSEIVLNYSVRKGNIVYAQYTIEEGSDDKGRYYHRKKYLTTDENGAPAAVPDKDGKFLGVINDRLNGLRSEKIWRGTLEYSDVYMAFYHLFRAASDEPLLEYAQDNNSISEYHYKENNEYRYIEGKLEGESEVIKSTEYRAKIVGLSNLYQAYFSVKDKAAQELFGIDKGFSYVRIKEGYDVDDETEQIKETVGIEGAEQHDMLLFYEGRSLYNPNLSDPTIILGVFAVILAVFVFFARLIINNAFELSSAYRLSQYSSLKTVGVSNGQMFVMVMGECLLYLIAALPIAVGLAFATGKAIISKIMSIKIFDALYGSGVTDKFFKLEISAPIMVLVIAITIFSVLLSAYAAAIRMIKMPAVQTRAADGTKPPRAVKRKWLTRRWFGYSAGFAVRCAFRKKMRFFITMLAAVVSATLVITIAALIYAVDKSDNKIYFPDDVDLTAQIESKFNEQSNISDDYKALYDSGLFRMIMTPTRSFSCWDKDNSWYRSFISDELNKDGFEIKFTAVTRESYKQINSDISYDELVQKGGVLLCSKIYKPDDYSEKWVESGDTMKSVPDRITVQITSGNRESGDTKSRDFTFDVSGTYTVKPNDQQYEFISEHSLTAIVPIDNFYELFNWVVFIDEDLTAADYNNFTTDYPMDRLSVGLVVKDGRQDEAEKFLQESFGSRAEITSNVAQKQTLERTAKALRIAGLSLAVIVFAVAMINVASTSATEMVNRRRELSMLRACGMSLRQVFKTLRIEVLFYSCVSTAISTLIGTAAASVIFKLIDENAKPAGLPFTAVIAVFGLMAAVMMCAYLLPLRNMSHSQIAQDIRMKE